MRSLSCAIAVQEAVARRIVESLRLDVPALRPRLARAPQASAESLEDYWRARQFLRRGLTAQNLPTVVGALERAVARDPSFALAFATLAEIHNRAAQAGLGRASALRAAAAAAAAHSAIAADSEPALGHATLAIAQLQLWDVSGTRVSIERAACLDDGQAKFHRWTALVRIALGDHPGAISAVRRAAARGRGDRDTPPGSRKAPVASTGSRAARRGGETTADSHGSLHRRPYHGIPTRDSALSSTTPGPWCGAGPTSAFSYDD